MPRREAVDTCLVIPHLPGAGQLTTPSLSPGASALARGRQEALGLPPSLSAEQQLGYVAGQRHQDPRTPGGFPWIPGHVKVKVPVSGAPSNDDNDDDERGRGEPSGHLDSFPTADSSRGIGARWPALRSPTSTINSRVKVLPHPHKHYTIP
jgi:hypothetical protein